MIKFFNKLRRKLIEEKRISAYFSYAVGEVFLVVIGILIALQVNNYNENKKLQNSASEHLLVVKEDLQKDREVLVSFRSKTKIQIEACDRIIDYFKGVKPRYIDLSSDLVQILLEQNFKNSDNGISLLLNNGEISILDQELQTLISEWTSQAEFIVDREQISNNFIQRNYEPYLIGNYSFIMGKGNSNPMFAELYKNDTREALQLSQLDFREDLALEKYVFGRRYQCIEQFNAYDKGIAIMDSLLEKIE